MKLIDKDKIAAEIEKRYKYWREKEFNSHNLESEIRMSECLHLMLLLNSIETKDMDLEEEIKSSMNNLCELGCYAQSLLDNPEDYEGFAKPFPKEVNDEIANFAKHFYELGLTQK